jgi:hypothetical protein
MPPRTARFSEVHGIGALPTPVFFHRPASDLPSAPDLLSDPEIPPDDPRHALFANFLATFSEPLRETFPVLDGPHVARCLRGIFDDLPPTVTACFARAPAARAPKRGRRTRIAELTARLEEARARAATEATADDFCASDCAVAPSFQPLPPGYLIDEAESDSEEFTETSSYE